MPVQEMWERFQLRGGEAPASGRGRGAEPSRGFFTSAFCRSCGLCCRATEMVLLRKDVERLERLGYRRGDFAVESGGFARLRNVDGYCYFYDKATGLCRVYEHRPLGCRLYPLVFDEVRGVLLDPECPLSSFFAEDCSCLRAALPVLRSVLEALGEEYGVRYDERVFEQSSKKLLSSCRP
ncbi:MAG: YkgJ family cysteine cluster protein [Thermofilum sp.]